MAAISPKLSQSLTNGHARPSKTPPSGRNKELRTIVVVFFVATIWIQFRLSFYFGSKGYEDFHMSRYETSPNDLYNRQKVVILAGPHKTGTTSVQNNMVLWTSTTKALQNWAWPVPSIVTELESTDESNWKWNNAKGFYAMMEALRDKRTYSVNQRKVFQKLTGRKLLTFYRTEFLTAWLQGKNIIFGSEAVDFVVKDQEGARIIDNLVDLLPWNNEGLQIKGNNNDITVVVNYRTPRVKHLISIWREKNENTPAKDRQSFREWVTTTDNTFGAVDSLGLAEAFLNKGLKVALVDGTGVSENGFDLSTVVACDVLHVECTPDKNILGLRSSPAFMNIKDGIGAIDVAAEQLELMEEVIKRYDCNFRHILVLKRLQLIYPETLLKNMNECEIFFGDGRLSRRRMKQQIVDIALGNKVTVADKTLEVIMSNDQPYEYYYTSEESGNNEQKVEDIEKGDNGEYYYVYYNEKGEKVDPNKIDKKEYVIKDDSDEKSLLAQVGDKATGSDESEVKDDGADNGYYKYYYYLEKQQIWVDAKGTPMKQ